jgi:hypothetical protein
MNEHNSGSSSSLDWYSKDKSSVLHAASTAFAQVKTQNSQRSQDLQKYLTLYDPKIASIAGLSINNSAPPVIKETTLKNEPLSINIVRRITDYAVNKVGKSYPGIKILTKGGNHETQLRAQELEKLIEGVFYNSKLYQKALKALLHGILLGTGIIKVVEINDRIHYEWVYPEELKIEEEEAIYGEPRSLYQSKWFDRAVIAERFGNKAKAKLASFGSRIGSRVEVVEAWRLPSSKEERDGRHIIFIPDLVVLLDEEWTHNSFPFAFFRYQDPPLGFWGTGLGRQLLPYQYNINLVQRNIQENIKAGGNLKIFVEASSGVNTAAINNDLRGTIIKYSGTPPQYAVTPSVSPDISRQLDFLIAQAWEDTGWSSANASGEKPAGLTSGVAIRNWLDSITERQVMVGKQWEDLFLQLAKLTIDAAERIYQSTKKFDTTYKAANQLRKIALEDALIENEEYEITIFSASRLPDTPSGRFEYVQDLINLGWIDKLQGMKLLDFPDIEAELSGEKSSRDLIDSFIAEILRGNPPQDPPARMDLGLALKVGTYRYLQAILNNAPPEVLENLDAWLDNIEGLINQLNQPDFPQPEEEQPLDLEQINEQVEEQALNEMNMPPMDPNMQPMDPEMQE